MYSLKVGANKSLVFPVMCYGYLTIDYDKHVPNRGTASTADDISYGVFGHDNSFTIATIVTPYDVNGLGADLEGNSGTGMHPFNPSGINDSKKTMPSQQRDTYTIGATAIDSGNATSSYVNAKNNLQSYNYLATTGVNERYNHEMMIFYNTNVQLSLLNATPNLQNSTNFIHANQPAEYKIKFTIKGDGSSDTLTSNAVITADSKFASPSGNISDLMKEGYDSNVPEVSYEKVGAGINNLTILDASGITTINQVFTSMEPIIVTSNPVNTIFVGDELFLSNGDYVGQVEEVSTGPDVILVSNLISGEVQIPANSQFYLNNQPIIKDSDNSVLPATDNFNFGEELFIIEEPNATGIAAGLGKFRKIGTVRNASSTNVKIAWDSEFSRTNSYYGGSTGKEFQFPFGYTSNHVTGVLVNGGGTSATWPVDTVDARTKLSIGDLIGDSHSNGDGVLTTVNQTSLVLNSSASYANDSNIIKFPALYRKGKKEAMYLINTHLIAASFDRGSGEMAIYYNGVKIAKKLHSSTPVSSFSFPLEDYYIGAKADFSVTAADNGAGSPTALTVSNGPRIAHQTDTLNTNTNVSTGLVVGQTIYNNVGQTIGTISAISSATITFLENIKVNLASGESIFKLSSSSDSDSDGNPNIDSPTVRKQFMGELHEFAITKGVWDSFLSTNTLIPPYKKLLLYYRFRQEELDD